MHTKFFIFLFDALLMLFYEQILLLKMLVKHLFLHLHHFFIFFMHFGDMFCFFWNFLNFFVHNSFSLIHVCYHSELLDSWVHIWRQIQGWIYLKSLKCIWWYRTLSIRKLITFLLLLPFLLFFLPNFIHISNLCLQRPIHFFNPYHPIYLLLRCLFYLFKWTCQSLILFFN